VGEDEVGANAVVLATGGFGANRSLWSRLPALRDSHEAAWYIGALGAQGDHLRLAAQVGAAVIGYGRGLMLATRGLPPADSRSIFPDGW